MKAAPALTATSDRVTTPASRPRSEQLRGRRALDRDLHAVLAEDEVALVELRHLAQHPLAHAGLVDLLGHVRDDEVLHARLLAQRGQLAVSHARFGELRAELGPREVV